MAPMIGPTRAALIRQLTSWLRPPRLPITLAVMEPRAVVRREGEAWLIVALVHDHAAAGRASEEALARGESFMPEHTFRFMKEGEILLRAPTKRAFVEAIRVMDGAGLFPGE